MFTASALLLALSLCLGGVSCEKEDAYRVGGLTEPQAVDPVLSLEISSLSAAAGDSVTLALAVPPEQERALGAVLGRLQLDPGKVKWIGEVADSGTIVEVNASVIKDGYVRLIAVNPRGLSQRLVTLAFEVTGADYAAGFSFTAEQVVDSAGKESEAIVAPGVSLATGLPAASVVRPSVIESIEPGNPPRVPPVYPRLLGDARANAVIDSVDTRQVAAIVVGNVPMPPAGSDDFYAADVTIDAVIDAVDAFVLSEYVDGVPVSQPIGEPVRFVIPKPDQVLQEGVVLNELTIELEESVAEERALVLMDSIARELGAAVEYRRGVSSSLRLFTFLWPGSQQVDVDATIQALTGLPEIVTAFQGFIVSGQHDAPDDNSWDGYPSGTSAREVFWYWGGERDTAGSNWGWKVLDMPLAWACQKEAPSVSVGIVDIGFYHNATFLHTDLPAPISAVAASADENGRFILTDTLPSDAVGHGLAVTGVLGARGNNQAGLTGVMWDSQLRFYQPGGRVDSLNTKDVYYLIREAVADGVNVLNLSLGYREDSVQAANTIGKLVTDALRPGIFNNGRFLAVIAAGSYPPDGRDAMLQGVPQVGADTSVLGDHVLVVSGVGRTLTRRAAANFGSVVDLYAPGEDIQLLSGSAGTRHDHGTSLAAPFVSGAAALI